MQPGVQHGRRVAIEPVEPHSPRAAVGPGPLGHVAGGTGDGTVGGQPGIEEQALAEGDGARVTRRAIARIPRYRRRPWAVLQDAADFLRLEVQTLQRMGVGAGQ